MPPEFFKTVLSLPEMEAAAPPSLLSETLCTSEQPLLLLPVRLETRFVAQPDGSSELRIRVYPDKIHLNSHEPDLNPAERDWATHYWEHDWRAGSDAIARGQAWDQLATRFGAPRAAWLARVMRPTNAGQRPDTPVPAGEPLSPPPMFPAVTIVDDGQNAAWRHAPHASLMPDHWIAVLQSAGQPILATTGARIANPLAVGPDPQATPPATPTDQATLDPGMQWMIDFAAAEAAGMGLRIRVSPAQLSAGLDTLIVLGVSASTSIDTAALLSELLDAHHYTDGLEFLAPGTSTNNTMDARAGYNSSDPGHAASFATEILADPSSFDGASNARRLGTAIGLSDNQIAAGIGHIAQAGELYESDARSMATALWQSGWGNYLANMVGFQGTGLTPDGIDWARTYFLAHVRSAGPLPTLRIGRQPYGILPVTSLDRWKPAAGQEAEFSRDSWLRGFLITLRDRIWRPNLASVPRIGARQPPDPDADLADIMRTDAHSTTYGSRVALGRHYLQHLRAFLGEDLQGDGFIGAQDAIASRELLAAGVNWRPRIAQIAYADLPFTVTAPLVQLGEVAPAQPLNPNYVATLLGTRSIDALIAMRADASTSLLEALLRHSLLREIARAAALIAAQGSPGDLASLLTDAELVDLVTGAAPAVTWRRQLGRVVPAVTDTQTIQQFLESATDFTAPSLAALGEFRASLAHLSGLDAATLQLLMQAALDLSTHRLDAWITSFATKRLFSMRAAVPTGINVGGYGWVENLRPVDPSLTSPVVPPPAGEAAPIMKSSQDSGFIHAPSMTHASAAALLRNAHLATGTAGTANGPFAIDLSSRRARDARNLLEGVREGQPLGALLGYRIERALHDLSLDAFISTLRQLAPLVAGKLEQTSLPAEAIAANNVVDGLVLQRKWQSDKTLVLTHLRQATASSLQLAAIGRELDALSDTIDGLSDALTAEVAYQVARGNTSRITGTLEAVARGEAPAPELEVTRQPRTGVSLLYRVLVLLEANPRQGPGWPTSLGARAAAEPVLNGWLAGLLGDPAKTRCTVEKIDRDGTILETHILKLSDVPLDPLDVIFGVEPVRGASEPGGTLTEVEQLVLFVARQKIAGLVAPASVRLQHARPRDLAPDEVTLLDVLEQARAARAMLSNLRGVVPEDLAPPERASSGTVDLDELERRVVEAEDAFDAAIATARGLVAQGPGASADQLRAGLIALARFGIASAIPVLAADDDASTRLTLSGQLAALLKTAQARADRTTSLRSLTAPTDERTRLVRLRDRASAVFGSTFVVLPRFSCDAPTATEIASAISESPTALGGDPLEVVTWMTRYARVREGLARLGGCLRGAEVLRTGERLNLSVAQLPFVPGERWIGLPLHAAKPLPAGKLSLVLQLDHSLDTSRPLAGVWIDEWTEVVPNSTETTALAFQFDPPDTHAPQSALLAVPPVPGQPWTVDTLHRVLVETLDLAKLRAIDPESLANVAQYLPGLFFAFNASDDVVSTDFATLTR